MPFSVSKFRSAFSGAKQEYVIAPSNYFEVQFMDLPRVFEAAFNKESKSIQKNLADESFRNMRFRCHHADIPSKQIAPMTRGGFMGPNRQMPQGSTFAPIQLDFVETPRFNIRAFFDAWSELCEGYHNNYINEYYDDIIMPEINIVMFSRDGKKIARWTLYDAWPSSITHSSVSWDATNSTITVGAEILYHRWESFWYPIAKDDCSIDTDDGPVSTKPGPKPQPKQEPTPPNQPTPQTDQPVPAKNQILRNEWGEPYITDTERKGNNLNAIDTTKYENVVIDTSSWNKTGVQAPSNKI